MNIIYETETVNFNIANMYVYVVCFIVATALVLFVAYGNYKENKPIQYIQYTEIPRGCLEDKDLEWFVTFICDFLKGGLSEVGYMAKGILKQISIK